MQKFKFVSPVALSALCLFGIQGAVLAQASSEEAELNAIIKNAAGAAQGLPKDAGSLDFGSMVKQAGVGGGSLGDLGKQLGAGSGASAASGKSLGAGASGSGMAHPFPTSGLSQPFPTTSLAKPLGSAGVGQVTGAPAGFQFPSAASSGLQMPAGVDASGGMNTQMTVPAVDNVIKQMPDTLKNMQQQNQDMQQLLNQP